MNAKKLVGLAILVVAAGATFAVSFLVSRQFAAPVPASASPAGPAAAPAPSPEVPRIEERHLFDLIKEVRQKLSECQKREQALDEREKRLEITRQVIEKEAQGLETLRVTLATGVTRLKETQADLDKTRITITQEESANLKRVAAVYDKMDAEAGGKILESMCANQQEADVVKILRFMGERSVAKILGEMSDKNLAARLSEQMKRLREPGAAPSAGGTKEQG